MGDGGFSVSIVIPTLNPGRAFGTVLHRIMGQGQLPLEILCADSGSTDGTRHIVSQFELARFVEIAEPPGPRSWNRAMEEARGDVIVFLSADVLPGNGDWLSRLTAPFGDASVAGVYGRQEVSIDGDPLLGFRLAQRFCREPHRRRVRVGDTIAYKSLPFFIDNAALRRSVWRGIHFNEHLPVGADRVWARQVVLASYTIGYAPDAVVVRANVGGGLKAAYRLALLTGYTDQHHGDEGGTLWPDSRHFAKRASWYLLRGLAWGRLPYLAIEDAVQRYGYKLGRRLDRLSPQLRGRLAPEAATRVRQPDLDDLAA
jgi:glycosyltransferase involved in cell wall biosynthesis